MVYGVEENCGKGPGWVSHASSKGRQVSRSLALSGRREAREHFVPAKGLTAWKMPFLFSPLQRVTSDTALKFLQSLKYSYTKQELLESELAVLNTLHFHINVSNPLAYVELLLEVLGHNGCLLPAKPLHQMCVQLLDFCYLTRETIYDTLLKIAIENSTPNKLQGQVSDSEGRFHALGCWNHQHRRVHPEPWALGSGCGAFELYHWHYSTEHPGVLVRGAEAHPGQQHRAQAAPGGLWSQSSQGQGSAPEIEPPCLELCCAVFTCCFSKIPVSSCL
ncbi:cyclin N-terminal domain-containing protein 1 isoform X2 [Myiozetetes cayanensis]|uniref:cyclin N-terminal domain-containing protein 1 isoform X2 n=1 Tax=Myiozetetes cayanensis TaxID=478635 RepID=UPI00215DDB27|nr:cyclin N-terminal domain-containing protein 1 isoform X2 [Myiozetetes cayanensis]